MGGLERCQGRGHAVIGFDIPASDDGPLEILCLGAHPDDIEIGCGGTILQLVERRPVRAHWVVFSGEEARAAEARDSATRFLSGAETADVTVHGFRDGYFPTERASIKDTLVEVREVVPSPDVIFTHDEHDLHQDHALLGAITRETFRDHLLLSYEIPKYDGGLRTPNLYATVAEETCRRKVQMLLDSFPSQRSRAWFSADTFQGLMRLRGVECASSSGFAEGFHVPKAIWKP